FGKKGSVTFANLASGLSINGVSYTIKNTIASLASAIAANPSGAYAFAANYDASQDGTYISSPVATVFTGSFEGLGNAISNSAISDLTPADNVGFFAHVGVGGVIADIRLAKINVVGPGLS